MKLLVILLAIISLCAASGIPQIPGDNSHYIEGESRWIWIPDGDGIPQLVDLHEDDNAPVDPGLGSRNTYLLFTRRNRNNAQTISFGNVNSIRNSNYDSSKPLLVIAHGWSSNRKAKVNTYIRDAYLGSTDGNVIVLDWNHVARRGYRFNVRNVPGIGVHLADFLRWLISHGGGNWSRVHLVGFSLGAHVVGNAGRRLNPRAIRVTGLDPAGPQWGGNGHALRSHDGVYVECIHTNGGTLGIFDPICETNFYPNGGRSQPNCWVSTCFHSRAYELFASSVRRPNHFSGRRCTNLQQARREQCTGSVLVMGNTNLNKRGSGLFGLRTTGRYPF